MGAIHKGSTMAEVRALFGEPLSISKGEPGNESWRYDGSWCWSGPTFYFNEWLLSSWHITYDSMIGCPMYRKRTLKQVFEV